MIFSLDCRFLICSFPIFSSCEFCAPSPNSALKKTKNNNKNRCASPELKEISKTERLTNTNVNRAGEYFRLKWFSVRSVKKKD